MGLGFMLAGRARRRFRLIFSGEIHPIYVETLRRNHLVFSRMRKGEGHNAPEEIRAFDLAKNKTLELVTSLVREAGGVDILIGGPPCQGFSSANRNSWSSDNPNNRLVSVFLKYVSRMKPPVFLMENVQGIVWTSRNGNGNALSVAEHALKRMKALGYLVFPKLLDAVWYGVPQYRTRFFLLGIRKDIGYSEEDFGSWGPFPAPTHGPSVNRPFVTVREAIGDLPIIGNGHSQDRMDYRAPAEKMIAEYLKFMRKGARRGSILDHVTSRHANYVIKRYRRIPEGGNWWDIADMMNNYSQLDRTHSNIYKRLWWNEPSITIGHYRKSMLIHPSQHRGLSLREGCRLQSFPDWFRFAGALSGRSGGLMHKQQQLANAVCPLLSKAIAEFLLEL
ncbi:MAG: DNA cytosine methyltransferase [Candidatus Kerfeldbacteria bacterium]|nr:DNA cytosine methyltransferase [Candidatus Kerfeldbacteria bacterium]